MSDRRPSLEDDQKSDGSLEHQTSTQVKEASSPSSSRQEGDNDSLDTMTEEAVEGVVSASPVKAEAVSGTSSLEGQLERKTKEISHLEEIVNEKSSTIKELEEKLNRQKDYENIKRELSLLKSEIAQIKTSVTANGEQKFLMEKTKALANENAALKAELSSSSSLALPIGRTSSGLSHPLLTPFLPPLQNVDAFSSLLGEEIANTYAKVFKAQAEAAAAAAAGSNSPLHHHHLHLNNSGHPRDLHVMTGGSSPSRPASPDDAKSSGSDVSPSSILHNNNLKEGMKPPTPLTLPKLEPVRSPTSTASLEKLQTQLRQNVEKFMNENLNTMNISRCVRELLSVHNIGQRLFAKYVLGLSQGTVSELLSKPKPWDKLTEKGRDSYRKMHAWAADEVCIYQLKGLVPRKGKDANFKQDDPAAEERIQAILSEAQRAMITPRTNGCSQPTPVMRSGPMMMNGEAAAALLKERQSILSGSASSVGDKDDNSSENGDGDQRLSPNPSAAVAYANFRRLMMKKEGEDRDHPGLPSEVVSRIYQEELAKIIGQQVEHSFRAASDPNCSQFDRSQDEVRQAFAIYQQEISRLSHLASMNPSLSSGADAFSRFSAAAAAAGLVNGSYMGLPPGLVDPAALAVLEARAARDRSLSQTENNSNANNASESGRNSNSSAFSLARKDDEGRDDRSKRFCPSPSQPSNATGAEDLSSAASPLQRMASITNSLLSQTNTPSTPSTPSRPAKAVLPPITQQQFDQYNNLNTEDIVKHVKEQLSQYSISQRLFGESVLGLSQGSVSDLLARPKPWHMLTQKGREPFIRMKMFLEDDGAVHKLVASQYKIAPEKLMRTTGFVAGPTGPPMNSHTANINALKHASRAAAGLESLAGKTSLDSRNNLSPHSFDGGRSAGSTPDMPTSLSAFAVLPSHLSGLFRAGHHPLSLKSESISPSGHRQPKSSPLIPGITGSSSRVSSYPQPSVYEMAALTTDLDTQIITTKIKETLLAHNIGQKIFGEVVLGLSQGSVSELLSKPKPWHMLSIKGREPFIRMQLWLSDPNNIEKLQTLKNERREANKRRRTNDDPRGTTSTRDSPLYNFNSNSSGFSPMSSGQSPFPTSGNSGYSNNNAKKPRILFSDEQKEALRLAFSMDSYPTQSTIEFLASELGLSTRTITNWFHNHRMRLKQVPNSGTSSDPDSSPAVNPFLGLNRDGVTFDTVQFRMLLSQRLADAQSRSRGGSQSDKLSKFHHGIFGSIPGLTSSQLYGNPNSCSSPGSSSQGDDESGVGVAGPAGTLDLSMTSNQHHLKKDRSLAGDSDRSRNSFDDDGDSDQSPLELDLRPSPPPQPVKTGSSRRKPAFVTSSSSRRKPAQPQWVDPGLHDYSGDEDEEEAMERDVDDDVSDCSSRSRREMNGSSSSGVKRKPPQDWEDEDDSLDAVEEGIAT